MPDAPGPPPARAVLPPLGQVLALAGEAASHRAELAALELDEAREHLAGTGALAAVAAALTLLGGVAFTALVAGLVWDDAHRNWWLGGLCAAYLLGAAAAGWAVRRRVRTWRPLEETRHQLGEDQRCLSRLFQALSR
jgi:uncharacterized membrane protein YqjE